MATVPSKRPSERVARRRAGFQRYKQDVKERGKPFYPYAMFHDTLMAAVVVAVIIGLACIWKWTAGGDGTEAGLLGPLYTEKADPGTTNFVPRPEWYFYFLFYLLRIFKWPDSVILGTIGIPTILLVILIALPFIDGRPERRLLRRPIVVVATLLVVVSMGVLTWKGGTARESLASETLEAVPEWIERQNLLENAAALPNAPDNAGQLAEEGARLFAESGCLTCHTYLGTGSSNLGAPDLTDTGAQGKGIDYQVRHLECPSCTDPGSPMPSFANLGDENLQRLAVFLEASKGEDGGQEAD
jgi:hypothetical protein